MKTHKAVAGEKAGGHPETAPPMIKVRKRPDPIRLARAKS
jgi:hypothetical protein